MIPSTIVGNLQSWLIQVFLIASIGALLPLIFRLRHPRSQLVYCHLLLVACLMLPLIQPWQHPRILVSSTPPTAQTSIETLPLKPPTSVAGIPWSVVMIAIIGSGIVLRLSW